ncbi:AAA family ATPase [Coleofasciculus sp. FACHB-T130]|uniref:AAA family ATPase n=1 Tax=Cyanophyceae TaxID=3028117 RepID=UPI001687FEBD|nr:AAA family ATPase [Coleofasciculus sp. FACHB-T130]MBD1877553.1 AAA family ATPase [Coleofasciculus sp. FACHB-T130]
MLRDLTIQNYRCFKDFYIDGLARVNLLVGMNNSGKTSLLEAVCLLVNQNSPSLLLDLLDKRGEFAEQLFIRESGEVIHRLNRYQIRHIFHSHQFQPEQDIHFKSRQESPLSLSLSIGLFPSVQKDLHSEDEGISEQDDIDTDAFNLVFIYISDERATRQDISVDEDGSIESRSFQLLKQAPSSVFLKTSIKSLFLTTGMMSFEQLAALWDKITLTPKENSIIEALQILEPAIERINFTSRQTFNSGILVKLRGQPNPIPLGSMGDGMRRILTLAMAAVTVENGFLIVDEIDTGLHYQTQTDMWRLILEISQRLNIQVFATTHSWDCITAFQESLAQTKDSSIGKLFRLSRKDENIRAVEYTPDELSIAVRQSIEVR